MNESLSQKTAEIRRFYEEKTITDRGLSYEDCLGFDIKEMSGKKVLDIGASSNDEFLDYAKSHGVDIVSMSPDFKNGLKDFHFKELADRHAARVQELPYRSDTFDYMLALYSVPYYLPDYFSEYDKFVSEIIRTLKSNGKAYFYPVNMAQKLLIKKVMVNFSNKASVQFSEEEDGKVFRMMIIKR